MTLSGPHSTRPAALRSSNVAARNSDKRFRRLVQTAWLRVPFYSRHWSNSGVQLTAMCFPEDLHDLPVVKKADLLAQPAGDLIDRDYADSRLTIEKTSGSSGQPIEIHKDRASVRRRSLRFLRALLSCGYWPGQRLMLISTRRTAGLMGLARWHYVDLRDEHLLEDYQRVRPDALYGPLSSLLQICLQARRTSIALHRPSTLISTAEQLMPAQRAQLEAAFGCSVADFYGMTEFGLIAFRRSNADGFESASSDLLLEFLPHQDGQSERLVVTDLMGGAMPMIRYDTGDLVRRSASDTKIIIREFAGRQIDSVRLPAGGCVSPYRITMRLEALPRLRQYQVVQRPDLSLDVYLHGDAELELGLRSAAGHAIAELCGELRSRIHFSSEAPHPVVGKFRPVQSQAGVSS